MRTSALLLTFLGFAAQLAGQQSGTPRFAQPTPMPSDRAEVSYAIYSELLKTGPYDDSRKQWLIEDTTNAIPLNVACQSVSEMNPHNSVQVPEDRRTEWNEVLADYDQHCHDVIQLDRESFWTELPVRLLNAEDTKRFDPQRPPAGSAVGDGLYRFTEVFFNANHTLAVVEQGMWCGMLCGRWTWVVLERKEGGWVAQPWVTTSMIS
jgi:hypothetical protein